jgi:hypothetical protein
MVTVFSLNSLWPTFGIKDFNKDSLTRCF